MRMMKMKVVGLRKAIKLFGGTEIEIQKEYHYQSGFFFKDGQLYYINTGDDRLTADTNGCAKNTTYTIYYRTAKDRKDFTGGWNRGDFVSTLANMGYLVKII